MSFRLNENFIKEYENKKAPFGFNGLGELVYMRTYSRLKPSGENEKWFETVQRVVNGTYNLQKKHIDLYNLGWNENKAMKSAEEMYDRIFNMKFLPPGRGLWAMGTDIIDKKNLGASLNNCGFISTQNIGTESQPEWSFPFVFTMDLSMLGVGIGFDTNGAGNFVVQKQSSDSVIKYIEDSREGWCSSVKYLLESFNGGFTPVFDYSNLRPEGEILKTFGGISSGPKPLIELHDMIKQVMNKNVGSPLSVTSIMDIMNLIGKCVVSGNIRRTALIGFGDSNLEEFLDLKDYSKNPDRMAYGWTSNNSVFAEIGQDYSEIAKRISINGEPGLIWLDNIKNYSRMCDPKDFKDIKAMGCNPCVEQSLEDGELCCLVENFINRAESIEDFMRTLKFSYLYAKTVTLANTHWEITNRVQMKNRRIGCSISGIAQFLSKNNLHILNTWLCKGYSNIKNLDKIYSDWFCIPLSIKMTSIKPSGTVSLLAGSTPGVHYPESRFYIRRMRISNKSPLLPSLRAAGYTIEQCVGSENTTDVVEIPIDIGEGIRTIEYVSMWEQLLLASNLQKFWADNQVSATITFDPKTEGEFIEQALEYFQSQLKGISFLPKIDFGSYPQMPYEKISENEYNDKIKNIKSLNFSNFLGEDSTQEVFCSNDTCTLQE